MLCSMEEALQDIKLGKMLILVDDEKRENEGDLVIAGEFVTPDAVNFMAQYARGLICIALDESIAKQFHLSPMVCCNESRFSTNFTSSVEAKRGVTTGISAFDRAHTMQVLMDDNATASDIVMPGHVFPLIAKSGGVLMRQGQTEASVDLARLAGLKPAGVICEILNPDGTMARMPQLMDFAKVHGIRIITVREIMRYRIEKGDLYLKEIERVPFPTKYGEFTLISYEGDTPEQPHLVLAKGIEKVATKIPLVRVHSECATGDIFGSLRCDCGEQLHCAMQRIEAEQCGAILYLRQEGRGIGLANKMRAYALQDKGLDTVEANRVLGFADDAREYAIAAQILKALGFVNITLLTNNPAKVRALQELAIVIQGTESIECTPCEENARYMRTKKEKMGHVLKKV